MSAATGIRGSRGNRYRLLAISRCSGSTLRNRDTLSDPNAKCSLKAVRISPVDPERSELPGEFLRRFEQRRAPPGRLGSLMFGLRRVCKPEGSVSRMGEIAHISIKIHIATLKSNRIQLCESAVVES